MEGHRVVRDIRRCLQIAVAVERHAEGQHRRHVLHGSLHGCRAVSRARAGVRRLARAGGEAVRREERLLVLQHDVAHGLIASGSGLGHGVLHIACEAHRHEVEAVVGRAVVEGIPFVLVVAVGLARDGVEAAHVHIEDAAHGVGLVEAVGAFLHGLSDGIDDLGVGQHAVGRAVVVGLRGDGHTHIGMLIVQSVAVGAERAARLVGSALQRLLVDRLHRHHGCLLLHYRLDGDGVEAVVDVVFLRRDGRRHDVPCWHVGRVDIDRLRGLVREAHGLHSAVAHCKRVVSQR